MPEKKRIADRYDASAEIYDNRYTQIQNQKYDEILSRVNISEENSIIDIGCGTGNFLGFLLQLNEKRNGKPFVGIDLSYEMIKIAHEKFPDIDFIVSDSDNLPIKSGIFDRIFSITHLQNVPNPEISLYEMIRLSNSKAIIIISILHKTWTLDSLRELLHQTPLIIKDEWSAKIEDVGMLCIKP